MLIEISFPSRNYFMIKLFSDCSTFINRKFVDFWVFYLEVYRMSHRWMVYPFLANSNLMISGFVVIMKLYLFIFFSNLINAFLLLKRVSIVYRFVIRTYCLYQLLSLFSRLVNIYRIELEWYVWIILNYIFDKISITLLYYMKTSLCGCITMKWNFKQSSTHTHILSIPWFVNSK